MKLAPASRHELSIQVFMKKRQFHGVPAWLMLPVLVPGTAWAQSPSTPVGQKAAALASAVSAETQRQTLQVGSQQEMVFAAGVERI
ncbi:MAG: hypothetical protein EOO29_23605, partial [Comamonadaceae bacterium]